MSDPVEINICFNLMIVDEIVLGIEHLDLCSLPVPLKSDVHLADAQLGELRDRFHGENRLHLRNGYVSVLYIISTECIDLCMQIRNHVKYVFDMVKC